MTWYLVWIVVGFHCIFVLSPKKALGTYASPYIDEYCGAGAGY